MNRTERLANLASLMALTPALAVALPTVVEVAAKKLNMDRAGVMLVAERNVELRAYFAQACSKAIWEV